MSRSLMFRISPSVSVLTSVTRTVWGKWMVTPRERPRHWRFIRRSRIRTCTTIQTAAIFTRNVVSLSGLRRESSRFRRMTLPATIGMVRRSISTGPLNTRANNNSLCRDAAGLGGHPAGEHVPNHLEIADKRPDRVSERRRAVLFHNEIREPREPVTDDKKHRYKKQPARPQRPYKQ